MFRIGYFQFRPLLGAVKKNRLKILQALKHAEADLIVLPELPLTGYYFRRKEEIFPLAEDPQNSTTVWELAETCAQKNLFVVTGFAEKSGDQLYNSALLIGPTGLMHTYRKLHLFNSEKDVFVAGDTSLSVQDVKGVKIGMMICFDWIFPETARILALKGAQVICHPSNLVLSYCQQAMRTRCLESNVFAVTANRYGTDKQPYGSLRFTGKSQIVAPRGELLHRAFSQREELFVTEIDPELANNKQITEKNDLFADRRPNKYRVLCEK